MGISHSGVPVDIHSTRVPPRREAVEGSSVPSQTAQESTQNHYALQHGSGVGPVHQECSVGTDRRILDQYWRQNQQQWLVEQMTWQLEIQPCAVREWLADEGHRVRGWPREAKNVIINETSTLVNTVINLRVPTEGFGSEKTSIVSRARMTRGGVLEQTFLRIAFRFSRKEGGSVEWPSLTTPRKSLPWTRSTTPHRCIRAQKFHPEHDYWRVAGRHGSSHGSSRQYFRHGHCHWQPQGRKKTNPGTKTEQHFEIDQSGE